MKNPPEDTQEKQIKPLDQQSTPHNPKSPMESEDKDEEPVIEENPPEDDCRGEQCDKKMVEPTPMEEEVKPVAPEEMVEPPINEDEQISEEYLIFSGSQFNQLFDSVELDNLAPLGRLPFITDDEKVDQRIRQIAENRGYKIPTTSLGRIQACDC